MPIEYRILGLFVVGTIKIISFRRDGKQFFTPCHLFIDEFQNFITPSLQEILEESRKYKLYLTLAQQQAGARMGKELFESILGNTAIKLTGVNGLDTLKTLAQETGDSVQKPPMIITMPQNTLNDSQAMTKKQWEALKTAQIEAYYRKMGETTTEASKTPQNPQKTQNLSVLDEFNDYYG